MIHVSPPQIRGRNHFVFVFSFIRAEKLKRNDGLAFRRAIMLPPVMASEEEIAREKSHLVQAVRGTDRAVGPESGVLRLQSIYCT